MVSLIHTYISKYSAKLRSKLAPQCRLTILMYHAVIRTPLKVGDWGFLEVESFQEQLSYLKQHYKVISLTEAVQRLHHGDLSANTAVITFDDGYQNNFEVAFPILFDAGLPATIFAVTGYLNSSDTVWTARLHHALTETKRKSFCWSGIEIDLSSLKARAQSLRILKQGLKQLPQPQLLEEVRHLVREVGDDPDHPMALDSPYRMLGYDAISTMIDSGLIELGAHSVTHAILSNLSGDQQRCEIQGSIETITKVTGRPCRWFAYPNGRSEDFTSESINLLHASKISGAVTAIAGKNIRETPLMTLKRIGIGATMGLADFRHLLLHD